MTSLSVLSLSELLQIERVLDGRRRIGELSWSAWVGVDLLSETVDESEERRISSFHDLWKKGSDQL